MTWGTLVALAELATLMSTTMLVATTFGRWFHDNLKTFLLFTAVILLTLIFIFPIQFAPPGAMPRLLFVGRRLLWWPTGWPLAMFESVMQANFVRDVVADGGRGMVRRWAGGSDSIDS